MHRRIALLAATALGLSSCALPSFGAPTPASEQGREVFDLYRWYAALATGVGVFVTVLLVFVVVRYRRRSDDAIPSQKPYNIPIEIAYTAIPLLIVSVLFVFSVRTEDRVSAETDDPDLVIDVTGFQWQWRFDYVESGVVVNGSPESGVPELVLPLDRTTRLELRTADVIHSFWVPDFLVKRDMIPGIDNAIDVTPTEVGTFDGVCAEYCGLDHGRMRFSVRVLAADDFDRWLEESAP
ncbi:cytochrome c oxidase subunit II [Actinospongicola halichondriae]|uniref:cytochrome c oxidase subunit II n=1 Tax=Actinospongicola halichondriae TaxID=3236844 RepID=UPI003D5760A9